MNRAYLKSYFAAYPLTSPPDALLLCLQSAAACGQLWTDSEDFLIRLEEERQTRLLSDALPLFEPICNGNARLNLASPELTPISSESILRMVRITNQEQAPCPSALAEGLRMVSDLAEKGEAPFSAEDFIREAGAFQRGGCPKVHHSEGYRKAYHPSYRIILSDFGILLPLIRQIEEIRLEGKEVTIAIDGPCGGGKTTLAKLLGSYFHCLPIAMDDFFLPPGMRTGERLSRPGGNLHEERFRREVLKPLTQGQSFSYHRFDCSSGQMLERVHRHTPVTIIEGSYSHHPAFEESYRQLQALRIFVSVDEEEQRGRLLTRNPEGYPRFVSRWIPLEKNYFQAYDIEGRADRVLRSLPHEPDNMNPYFDDRKDVTRT